jgi:hypothetical protein
VAVGGARHGLAAPRGETPRPGARGGRFGRLFDALPRHDAGAEATEALAAALVAAPDSRDNPSIPAGYTYLGQFIDHDITFDPVSQLQRDNDPSALADFRTPRFDLDSVYGTGPADQPYLYDWSGPQALRGVKLLVGASPARGETTIPDLPRNAQQRALIGDGRNDENLIVAQLHLLFLQFHNRVVDDLVARGSRLEGADLLEEARRRVRWHYQWIVIYDYLPRVAGRLTATVERRHFAVGDDPYIPIEFSAAAFRFAHSMVRERYQAKRRGITVPILPPGLRPGRHLGGLRRLPPALRIDWERFFALPGRPPPQVSMGINERLAAPLRHLPPDGAALARLNLQRGRALGLPAGADVARAMGEVPLTAAELKLEEHVRDKAAREALLRATPLWYYLLREAGARGAGGQHLGPVGGRIVSEVLTGLLDADTQSFRRQWPGWRPELAGPTGRFGMPELIAFTEAGRR